MAAALSLPRGRVAQLGPTAFIAAGGLLYVTVVALLLQSSYDIAGGVVVAHVLALPTVPLLLWLTRTEVDRRVRTIILVGLVFKLVGTLARFVVIFGVYGGGDAFVYDRIGSTIAEAFRNGDLALAATQQLVGTGFIEIFTGVIYFFTGATRLGGFLVYSWLGYLGLCLFYCAFRLAVPDGDRRRYTALIFFLPSMAFWPSSTGKEAWMTLVLGMTAYGVAKLVSRRRNAVLWLAAGIAGSAVVRPHIAITLVAALGVAYFFSGARRPGFGAPIAKVAGLLTLLVVFGLVLSAVEAKFKLEEGEGVEQVFERTREQTSSEEGSSFEAVGARSPTDLPLAAFSVLFRPFPFEARNAQALVASLEGTLLLFLFVKHWRKLGNLLPRRRAPFLAFVSAYSVLFVIAFSNFGNFGILARQRVQVFPFILVLLAVPRRRRRPDDNVVAASKLRSGSPGNVYVGNPTSS